MGLNTLVHPHDPGPAAGTGGIQPGTLTPQDLWSIYDLPAGATGAGESIAVIGEGDSSATVSALSVFEDHHALPHVPVTVTREPADGDYSDPMAVGTLSVVAALGVAGAIDRSVRAYERRATRAELRALRAFSASG